VSRVSRDEVELLKETGAKFPAFTKGLLKLRVGGGCGGAVAVGIRHVSLQLLRRACKGRQLDD